MASAFSTTQNTRIRLNPWLMAWMGVLAATVALYYLKDWVPWAFKYPKSLIIPFSIWLSDLIKWLMNSFDLGLFTFKELTRFLSWLIEQPYNVFKSFLSHGFLSGQGSYAVEVFPRVSWIAMIVGCVLLGRYAKDWKLAALMGGCLFYLAIFDKWDSAMVTLASIVVAVPLGVITGLVIGVWGSRSARREAIVIFCLWVTALLWVVPYCYFNGYGGNVDPSTISMIMGIPTWLFWGIFVPWLAADAFTIWFCFFYMMDDDLGEANEDANIHDELGDHPAAKQASQEGGA